jgi:hypothetical protein
VVVVAPLAGGVTVVVPEAGGVVAPLLGVI